MEHELNTNKEWGMDFVVRNVVIALFIETLWGMLRKTHHEHRKKWAKKQWNSCIIHPLHWIHAPLYPNVFHIAFFGIRHCIPILIFRHSKLKYYDIQSIWKISMLDAQFSTKYCFDCEYFVSSNYNLHYFLHTRQNIQRQNSISYKIESQRTSNIVRFHSCVISSLIQNCRLAPDKYF